MLVLRKYGMIIRKNSEVHAPSGSTVIQRGQHGRFAAMAAAENNVELKRKADDNQDGDGDGEEDEWVGPMPSEATKAKKRKGLFLAVRYFVTFSFIRDSCC